MARRREGRWTSFFPTAPRRGSTAGRASVRSPASRAPSCTESGSRTVTSRPTGTRRSTPSSHPISCKQSPTAAARPGSSRPLGSGKTRVLTERFRLLVARRGWGSTPVCAVAYNVRAKDEMAKRLVDIGGPALRKIRTLHALGNDIVRRSRSVQDVLGEWDVRRRIEPLVPVRPRANTDMLAPYLEALGEVRLGLLAPEVVEAQRDDVEGFAAMFARYRARDARRRGHGPRRADLRRARSVAHRPHDSRPAAGGVPAPARRRVPGPHTGAAPDAAVGRRTRLRRVRRRRRRPGDLRLRRRGPEVPHRLRPVLSRRGRTSSSK